MQKSIVTRYFRTTAVLLLCSIFVMGGMQTALAMGYFRNENYATLLNTVDNAVTIVKEYGSDSLPHATDNVARDISIVARAANQCLLLTDPYGKIVVSNEKEGEGYKGEEVSQKLLNITYLQGAYTEVGTLGGIFSQRSYVAGRALTNKEGDTIGFLFAASDASALGGYLADIFSIFIMSAGLMLLVSSVLSIVLTARLTTPLRRMSDAAKQFGNGDFSVRVPVQGDDEIARLAVTFNNMARSLQQIDSARSSFMGNIAHELRTPMTSIKGFVDGMLDGTIPPENRDHYLSIVSEEVGRLTRLIKNMLDITKLESGEYTVNARTYDVWESVTGVVFSAEQRIEAKHVQLSGFAPVKTMVYADADLVYQVLYNLVDNALKFCNEGGELRFAVTRDKGMVTVRVRNSGAGIAKEALPFVFDRFYKEDKSRGLNAAGSGLGLHICKVLVNLSGGEIWAESEEDKYCEFAFTLPETSPEERGKGPMIPAPRQPQDVKP